MGPHRAPETRLVQAFYAVAAIYLAVGLASALRAPGRAARPGLGGQLAVARGVLAAGLLWPERWRAGFDPLSF